MHRPIRVPGWLPPLTLILLAACAGRGDGRDAAPDADGSSRTAPSASPMAGAASAAGDGLAADPDGAELLTRLNAAAPARDPLALALRMGRLAVAPDFATPASPPQRRLGDVETFWLHDINAQRYFEVEARLEAIRDSAYFWVQTDQAFDPAALARGADGFDAKVYPAVREVYGTEWSPGIDGDPRVHVLHHQPVPGIAGYFYSVDEQPRSVEPNSNEREMFYINLSVYTPGSYDYLALLAHELQHMIHWHHDPNEAVWANEGLSELASEVAGYRGQNGSSFFAAADLPLLEWEADSGANAGHYAASYAFFAWLRARFGDPVIRAFVEADSDGVAGVEAALAAIGQPMPFDAVFLDWAAANGLPPDIRRGRALFDYGRSQVSRAEWSEWPAEGLDDRVAQYGSDYYDLSGAVTEGRLRLDFAGATEVGLLEPLAPGAQAQAVAPGPKPEIWWSGRGDNIDSRLTLALDLRTTESAALDFELWQAVEEHWDYGYYRVSADDGRTWQALTSPQTTEDSPSGINFGAGLTGQRGGWLNERLDLDAYAGSEILLRWELVTDDAVNLEGLAIRGLSLETGSGRRAIEPDDPAFSAEGWRRVPPVLPQRWGLQVLVFGPTGLKVWRPEVDRQGRARIEVGDIPDDATVIGVVSGLTPATRQPASYRIAPAPPEG
ncbi:MAG: immune inhibitor A [Caldilineae bacterium]|nr:immune inhibitor A [Caldilineae bacterium]